MEEPGEATRNGKERLQLENPDWPRRFRLGEAAGPNSDDMQQLTAPGGGGSWQGLEHLSDEGGFRRCRRVGPHSDLVVDVRRRRA